MAKLPSLSQISWKIDTDTVVMAALVVGDSWNFTSGACPSYFTTAEFASSGDPEKAARGKQNIRRGYRLAAVQALFVGSAITLYTRSWLPLAAAGSAVVVSIAMYEHALRQRGGDVAMSEQA